VLNIHSSPLIKFVNLLVLLSLIFCIVFMFSCIVFRILEEKHSKSIKFQA
jgi:hypothetical protein